MTLTWGSATGWQPRAGRWACTTYQAGKLLLIGWNGQQASLLPRTFPKAMGLDVAGERLVLATREEVLWFADAPLLAHNLFRGALSASHNQTRGEFNMSHLPAIPARLPKGPLTLAVLAALYGPAADEALAAPTPAGTEFRVNTYVTNDQRYPAVAMDADGDFVVTWESWAQKNNDVANQWDIYAQRYNAAGMAQGPEFLVDNVVWFTNSQADSAVAMDADGDFVVTWESYIPPPNTNYWNIWGQRFKADGTALGEFRVNTTTANSNQRHPAVAMDAAGDFVVAWSSSVQDGSGYGIYAQRYNASGVAQGSEFRVNNYTADNQNYPAVAMDADGDFVVVWASRFQDNSDGYGVYAQRYNAAGTVQGSEFRVNTYTTGNQNYPAVAMDADGDFVVTWESLGQEGSVSGIYARRYNAAGVAQDTPEFRVNTYTTSTQYSATVTMDADGDFVVTWESTLDSDGWGIFARRYNAAGVAQDTPEFRVNTYTTSNQVNPAVAMDAAGDFLVAWQSPDYSASDGIYAQRYSQVIANANFNPPVLSGKTTNPTPVTDGDCGVFSFTATFCNKTSGSPLTGLVSQTVTLSNNNVLLNRSWGAAGQAPKGVGSGLSFPPADGYSDYQLTTGECVAVPYQIGLTCPKRSFSFYVDVEGM